MNVHVLDVDGGSERLERIVVETVQRGHQPQVLGDSLRDGLRERMIVNRQRDVAAQQIHGVKFVVFVLNIAGASSQCHDSGKLAGSLEWSETLEKFWRDVAVGTEED